LFLGQKNLEDNLEDSLYLLRVWTALYLNWLVGGF